MARNNLYGHHIIPVSLGGMNYVENIVDVTGLQHDLIHQTLDVSQKLLRSFRCKTNHLLMTPNETYLRELIKLHHLYFARLPMLPDNIQKIHAESIKKTALRYRKENGLQPLDDCAHATWHHMFVHWLGVLHDTMFFLVTK